MATYFVTFGWRGARASNYYWLRQTTSAILQVSELPLIAREDRLTFSSDFTRIHIQDYHWSSEICDEGSFGR